MEKHITLYGDAAELFAEIQEDLEEDRGMETSNAGVVKRLMEESDRPSSRSRR